MDLVFFFFSSRRRHTRCSRDWSSDVCSSDLDGRTVAAMDVLAPGIGEIIGGSQREERLEVLDRRMEEMGLDARSEEHTSELQSRLHLVCRLLLEKKKKITENRIHVATVVNVR